MIQAELPNPWTPLQVALHKTVHEFERGHQKGASALGEMLGKSPAVISNEVNPAVTSHKHGLEDSITLQLITQDYRILHAYSQALNHIVMPMPEPIPLNDMELLSQFSQWMACVGKTCSAVQIALDSHRLDQPMDTSTIRKFGQQQMSVFLTFIESFETLLES